MVLWLILRKLPPADWKTAWSADGHGRAVSPAQVTVVLRVQAERFLDGELVEKIVLVSLVSLILASILPCANRDAFGLQIAVVLVIGLNTVLSEWLTRRGVRWRSTILQFLVMLCINAGIAMCGLWLLSGRIEVSLLGIACLFVLLGTLLMVLYDRYQPIHREGLGSVAAPATGGDGDAA